MKAIVLLGILALALALSVSAEGDYCSNLIDQCKRNFSTRCAYRNYTIETCCDLKMFKAPSGIYQIKQGEFHKPDVYCDMETDGGGWIVIQRNRKESKLNFNRPWKSYEGGFGDLKAQFWYGLRGINCLTQTGNWEMKLEYQNLDKTWSYLHYNTFKVGTAAENYKLTVAGFTLRTGDYFSTLNGYQFSASNKDNDGGRYNCAAYSYFKSGFWYRSDCVSSYKNYISINSQPPYIYGAIVLFTEMKIRLKDCLIV